jgi:hypothetical protein
VLQHPTGRIKKRIVATSHREDKKRIVATSHREDKKRIVATSHREDKKKDCCNIPQGGFFQKIL